jgi:hypothetical protein
MRVGRSILSSLLLATFVACGSSEAPEKAEAPKAEARAAEPAAAPGGIPNANDVAKGLDAMAKGLNALSGGDPNMKPVEPVSFRDLQAAFGDLDGWEKGKPTGEKMTMPVSFSKAEVTYRKGQSRIKVEISDSAFNQLLMVPFSMFLTSGYEKETESGYEKSTKVGEHPGWETWNSNRKSGELNAIVAKRFIVQVDGDDLDDVKMLHTAMASVDLNKLASLK